MSSIVCSSYIISMTHTYIYKLYQNNYIYIYSYILYIMYIYIYVYSFKRVQDHTLPNAMTMTWEPSEKKERLDRLLYHLCCFLLSIFFLNVGHFGHCGHFVLWVPLQLPSSQMLAAPQGWDGRWKHKHEESKKSWPIRPFVVLCGVTLQIPDPTTWTVSVLSCWNLCQ